MVSSTWLIHLSLLIFCSYTYATEKCCTLGIKYIYDIELCSEKCCDGLIEHWANYSINMKWCDKSEETLLREARLRKEREQREKIIQHWYRMLISGVRFG